MTLVHAATTHGGFLYTELHNCEPNIWMQQSSAVIPEICVYNAVVTTRRVTSLTAGFLDPRFECVGSRTNQLVNRASFIKTGVLILRKKLVYKRIYFPAKIGVAAAGCRSGVASMNGLQASVRPMKNVVCWLSPSTCGSYYQAIRTGYVIRIAG